jgi:hypothetical protein
VTDNKDFTIFKAQSANAYQQFLSVDEAVASGLKNVIISEASSDSILNGNAGDFLLNIQT